MRKERKRIISLLEVGDVPSIIELDRQGVPVFRILLGLSYDKTALVCWRAIEAVGALSAALAPKEPDRVRNMVRRLVWTLSDECGGMAWSAPEMLAEIAAHNPVLCSDIPLIVVHLDEPPFRFGATWAAGRLAETHPADAATALSGIIDAADHADPSVRGAVAWALGRLRAQEGRTVLERLGGDDSGLSLYLEGELQDTTVGSLAEGALRRLETGS